jgi:hypothetical protein
MNGRAVAIFAGGILAAACGQDPAPVASERTRQAAPDDPMPTQRRTEPRVERGRAGKPPPPVEATPVAVAPTGAPQETSGKGTRPSYRFVVPRRALVVLGRETVDGARTARLDLLVAAAGNGCPYVGPLRHSTRYDGDRLVVRVEGYERSGPPPKGAVCTANVQHATATVVVDRRWLLEGDRQLVVEMRGAANRFAFDYDDYYATLTPEARSNVRLQGRTTELFPMDVAELYVAGSTIEGEDYRPALRDFAHEQGWEPADEVYDGIRQPHPDRLYAVVRDRAHPRPNRSDRVGKLSRGVHVYLTRIEDSFGYA